MNGLQSDTSDTLTVLLFKRSCEAGFAKTVPFHPGMNVNNSHFAF